MRRGGPKLKAGSRPKALSNSSAASSTSASAVANAVADAVAAATSARRAGDKWTQALTRELGTSLLHSNAPSNDASSRDAAEDSVPRTSLIADVGGTFSGDKSSRSPDPSLDDCQVFGSPLKVPANADSITREAGDNDSSAAKTGWGESLLADEFANAAAIPASRLLEAAIKKAESNTIGLPIQTPPDMQALCVENQRLREEVERQRMLIEMWVERQAASPVPLQEENSSIATSFLTMCTPATATMSPGPPRPVEKQVLEAPNDANLKAEEASKSHPLQKTDQDEYFQERATVTEARTEARFKSSHPRSVVTPKNSDEASTPYSLQEARFESSPPRKIEEASDCDSPFTRQRASGWDSPLAKGTPRICGPPEDQSFEPLAPQRWPSGTVGSTPSCEVVALAAPACEVVAMAVSSEDRASASGAYTPRAPIASPQLSIRTGIQSAPFPAYAVLGTARFGDPAVVPNAGGLAMGAAVAQHIQQAAWMTSPTPSVEVRITSPSPSVEVPRHMPTGDRTPILGDRTPILTPRRPPSPIHRRPLSPPAWSPSRRASLQQAGHSVPAAGLSLSVPAAGLSLSVPVAGCVAASSVSGPARFPRHVPTSLCAPSTAAYARTVSPGAVPQATRLRSTTPQNPAHERATPRSSANERVVGSGPTRISMGRWGS